TNYNSTNYSAVLYFYDEINNEITYQLFSDTVTTRFRSCIPAPDGGLMAFGEKRLTADNRDFLLVKYDSLFQEEWVKTYGFRDRIDEGQFIAKTSSGGFVMSGKSRNLNFNLEVTLAIEINDTGKVIWQNQI